LIGKVTSTIYEGRALLSDNISKLNACRNEGVVRAFGCVADVVASAYKECHKNCRRCGERSPTNRTSLQLYYNWRTKCY